MPRCFASPYDKFACTLTNYKFIKTTIKNCTCASEAFPDISPRKTHLSLYNIHVFVADVVRAHQLTVQLGPFGALPAGRRGRDVPPLCQVEVRGREDLGPRRGIPPAREQDQPDRTGLHVTVRAGKTTLMGQRPAHLRHAVQEAGPTGTYSRGIWRRSDERLFDSFLTILYYVALIFPGNPLYY